MKYSPSDYAHFLYETKNPEALLSILQKHWVVSWLPKILEEFDALSNKKEGALGVNVKSAYPLDSGMKVEIGRLIKKEGKGRPLRISFGIDKNVIGGFRAESDEMRIGASVEDSLRHLQINFTK